MPDIKFQIRKKTRKKKEKKTVMSIISEIEIFTRYNLIQRD